MDSPRRRARHAGVRPGARVTFTERLVRELLESMANDYGEENWDAELLGPSSSGREANASKRARGVGRFSALYDSLGDEASKEVLVELLAYRLLGHTKVKLPPSTPSYWEERARIAALAERDAVTVPFRDWELHRHPLRELGYPLQVYSIPPAIQATFAREQYAYRRVEPAIRAEAGDYVIDGGGCWGDTALYFANEVGPEGKVFSFEFAGDNLPVLQRNLALNPDVAGRIAVVEQALWDSSGVRLAYSARGPATTVGGGPEGVAAVSLDDFVRQADLERVDFVKLDVEGAEAAALRGGEETLRRFRPKLAVAVYHRAQDMIEIASYLKTLDLKYELFLDHFTITGQETVLFAHPRS
jgi:FkbM family methyltransferase